MTNLLVKDIPKESTALQRVVSSDNDGNTFADNIIVKSTYEPVFLPNGLDQNDPTYAEYHKNVVSACAVLSMAFPPTSYSDADKNSRAMFYSTLYYEIENNQIPIARLKDAINNVIATQRYFKIADILSFDKKAILSETKGAISRRLKREVLNIELAITYEIVDNRVVRFFALIDEIKHSEYYMKKILGVWDDNEHCWKWIESVNDPSMEERKAQFKNSLYKFCDSPGYHGPYKVEVVKSFYDYFSRVVMPGDKMLWELKPHFDPETWLVTWNQRYYEENDS